MPLIHDISVDRPRDVPPYKNFDAYLIIYEIVIFDHRQEEDTRELYDERANCVARLPYEKIMRAYELGVEGEHPRLGLELGLRHLAQCEVPDIKPEALVELFLSVTPCPRSIQRLRAILDASDEYPHLLAHTLGCLAYLWFRMHFHTYAFGWRTAIDECCALVNAAFFADLCADMGFVPRVVLMVADWLAYSSRRWGVDMRAHPRYRKFRRLFAAYDEYLERQEAQEAERRAKVARAPNQYRCAVEGCGIQATSRSALRRCGGNCHPATKPHYCSEECQERHWLVHQFVCKRRLAVDLVADADGDPDWADEAHWKYHGHEDDFSDDDRLGGDGMWRDEDEGDAECFVEFPHWSAWRPGELVRIRSRTFTPAFLRCYKWTYPVYAETDDGYPRMDRMRESIRHRPRQFVRGHLQRKRKPCPEKS